MPKDIFVCWRVAIEIMNRSADSRDVRGVMCAEERFVGGEFRQTPFPVRMSRAQMRRTAHNPRRTLRMSGRGIFGALWIVKENQTRFSVGRVRGSSPSSARSGKPRGP